MTRTDLLSRNTQAGAPWFGAGLVLAVLLALTWFAWARVAKDERAHLQSNFEDRVDEAQDRLVKRMIASEQVLWGVRAVFAGSQRVERAEFRDYVSALRLADHSPGIQAIGYVRAVKAEALQAHLAEVRQSLPRYEVHPAGERDFYAPIMFLAPFEGRNLVALGFDMFTEPVRAAAMQTARDQARAVLSGRVRLVQEPDGELQSGALMYVPVYANRHGPPQSPEERRAALEGWTYVAFRMGDLIEGTFTRSDELVVRLFDGTSLEPESLLFDSSGDAPRQAPRPGLVARRVLRIAERDWTLLVEAKPAFGADLVNRTGRLIGLGGTTVSVLAAALVFLLLGARSRAERHALSMNRELLEAHAALAQSELRLRLATRGGDLATWDFSFDDERLRFSERFSELLGVAPPRLEWSLAELEGRTHPDDFPVMRQAKEGQARGEAPTLRSEIRLRHERGHWVWVQVSGMVVELGPGGKPVRAAGTVVDITERKRAETERAELLERFAQAERAAALGTLAGGMAHQINNPLAVVISNLSFAREQLGQLFDPALTNELKDAMDDAAESAGRVRDLVAELRSLTATDRQAGASSGLPEVLEGAVRAARAAAGPSTTFELSLPPGLPSVRGSESELVHLFCSLLTNAAQSAGDGRPNPVRISAERDAASVRVSISDQGVGMSPEHARRVFDPFFTTRGFGGGKGLGGPVALAIARSIGGDLELESEEGRGTTVKVTLPLAARPA